MNERAINLRDWEVRAFIAGRKTQIRRVVKPQPGPDGISDDVLPATPYGYAWRDDGDGVWHFPFGYPGDRLWVRETWARDDEIGVALYRTDVNLLGDANEWELARRQGVPRCRWRPSSQMPRWASRITLEIVSVRVERLNQISAAGAWAEGVQYSPDEDPFHEFMGLWEFTNGPGSWDANPWVWVIEVKTVTP